MPIAPGDGRCIRVDIAGNDEAIGWQSLSHGEGRITGEGADLENPACTGQLDQQGHELSLFRRDLHHGIGLLGGLLAQSGEQRRVPQRDLEQIVVDVVG